MFKRSLVTFIIIVVSLSLFSEGINKLSVDENLYSLAKEKGFVKVIVKINVPNLSELTKASTRFKTGDLKRINRIEMESADIDLSSNINKSAESVLFNLNNSSYTLNHIFKTIPYISINADEVSLRILDSDPEVLAVIHDKPLPLPKFERNTEAENNDVSGPMLLQSIGLIGADIAWNYGLTGSGWYVAVLDTGIRKTHNMFKGKNIIEQCYSYEGSCPDGSQEMSGTGSAAHYDSKYDGYDHGSHVAGIAIGNNKDYLFGVAKDANLIAVQVFSKFDNDSYCGGGDCVLSYNSDQLKGLEYVYSLRGTYNIAAINMSLGGGSYSSSCDNNSIKSIIDNLKTVGIATAIATGNDGYCNSISSPACISSAVSVGGTDKNGNEYYNSNWKTGMVDLNAPGVSIKSATGKTDSSYSNWNGTSMATPHVAGTWALFKQFDSNLSVDDILEKLQENRSNIISRCDGSELKMQIDVEATLTDFIKLFPPLNFEISQVRNKSLLQTEYVNVLTWERNPLNEDKNIVSYKVYLSENSSLTHLTTVSSDILTYYHRNVQKKADMTYVITSLNDKGEESVKYYKTIKFN